MNPNRPLPPVRNNLQNARIAAIQMVSGPDIAENLAEAGRLIATAAAEGAQLLALPEYFPLMGMNDSDKIAARETEGNGPIQHFLVETAARHGIWLIGGSIPLVADDPGKVLNSTLVYDPYGQQVARYDKIHLFGFKQGAENYNEAATIEAGRKPVAFDTPFGRVGLSICYDLRFPELYRGLSTPDDPLDLIVVPAAFTATTGQAHWEILLRARAIENLCYVMAAAQGGTHRNGRQTHGDSMIIDPWGKILNRQPQGAGVVSGLLDRAYLTEIRSSLPALEHRVLNSFAG